MVGSHWDQTRSPQRVGTASMLTVLVTRRFNQGGGWLNIYDHEQ